MRLWSPFRPVKRVLTVAAELVRLVVYSPGRWLKWRITSGTSFGVGRPEVPVREREITARLRREGTLALSDQGPTA